MGVVIPNQRATVERVGAELELTESLGYDHAWMPGIPNGPDVLTMLALTAHRTQRMEIGPAIVSAHGRHPVTMASEALTLNDALAGRLTLGIGVSHQRVVEGLLGVDYSRPARFMAEYLQILRPLLDEQSVDFTGERLRTRYRLAASHSGYPAPSVFIAAVGPKMIEVAGTYADGVATWMVGPRSLAEHTVPLARTAAQRAGRGEPRVLVSLPFLLTHDLDRARALAMAEYHAYGKLAAYQPMLEREGVESAADLAVCGDEATLKAAVDRIRDAGVTDLQISTFGDDEGRRRTIELMATLK